MRAILLGIGLLLLAGVGAWAAEPLLSAQADLNGDGAQDTITVTSTDGSFTLRVGAQTVTEKIGDFYAACRLTVVDVDPHGRLREVDVEVAEGSDNQCYLFGFVGTALRCLGVVPQEMTVPGNGFVYGDNYCGFWHCIDKYALNGKTRLLEQVAQPYYYVGAKGTVTVSLPIYLDRDKKSTVVANLQPKSLVLFLVYRDGWYLVKSTSGLVGWLPETQVTGKQFPDLPWSG